jgi:hypothetical protein
VKINIKVTTSPFASPTVTVDIDGCPPSERDATLKACQEASWSLLAGIRKAGRDDDE